jgi:hypothetical protein
MSVFRVKLNNNVQGNMDVMVDSTSIQRTIFVNGPKKIYRKLKDGDTFTDCNYWKRFAYPQIAEDQAFIEVVSDDGSIYSDVEQENNFPNVYAFTATDGSGFDDNVADIVGDYGAPAYFVQITNKMGGGDIRVKLNGLAGAVFDLLAGDTQVFNYGDLAVTKIQFENSSGASADIQVLVSVQSAINS